MFSAMTCETACGAGCLLYLVLVVVVAVLMKKLGQL